MRQPVGQYSDWRFIVYKPEIAEIAPHNLLPFISEGQTALDIGCNSGGTALFLAREGLKVLGVDINPDAIAIARTQAARAHLSSRASFMTADITEQQRLGVFDVILMIRLLTCFPSVSDWRTLLDRAHSFIKPGGLIYINDFMITQQSKQYRKRYEAAAKSGWRPGNFAVNDSTGKLFFIAHHHSTDELQEIIRPYVELRLRFYHSLSMSGNKCDMFEFIGQKTN